MQNLFDFFINYKHWFVFILLEVASLVFLFSYNGYQKSVYFTTANGVVGTTYNAISSVSSYIDLKTVNRQLETDNEALRQQVQGLQQQLIQLGIDSMKVVDAVLPYKLINAQVINNTLHRSNNLLTIDKGKLDGIKPEMGVVSSSGVVGIVYMVSDHYSIVMPLLNESSKISCRVKDSEYFGTLRWERGKPDVALASGFPRHAKFKTGQVVETNGFSDIFPAGIPIGYVFKIQNSTDGMSYQLRLQLYTDFKCLRYVSVIADYTQPERKQLEEKADSLSLSSD